MLGSNIPWLVCVLNQPQMNHVKSEIPTVQVFIKKKDDLKMYVECKSETGQLLCLHARTHTHTHLATLCIQQISQYLEKTPVFVAYALSKSFCAVKILKTMPSYRYHLVYFTAITVFPLWLFRPMANMYLCIQLWHTAQKTDPLLTTI
jgi:hypothetical protein